jgi:phage head maturation protease
VTPGGSDWETDPTSGVEVRTVKKIARLFDVSPVTFPAYLNTDTSVAKRSLEAYKKEHTSPSNTWKTESEARERILQLNQI